MNKNGSNAKKSTLTRREAIRIAGVAAVTSSALFSVGSDQATESAKSGIREKDTCRAGSSTPSLFLTCQPPSADKSAGANKYRSGDSLAVFPLVAFWLLVTTDNWDECLNKPGWISGLVKEFGRENKKLTCDELSVLEKTMGDIWTELSTLKQNQEALERIRTIFSKHRQIVNVYGHPPCPSGATCLDIVGVIPKRGRS